MNRVVRAALAAFVAVAFVSASQAKPVISGSKYMESVYHDCDPANNNTSGCELKFTRIPKDQVLTIQNVNCSMTTATGTLYINNIVLKVGAQNTQVALPSTATYSSSGLYYAVNQQVFAFSTGLAIPTIETSWSDTVNGDMTCTIAGTIETAQ
jgi:hypothetical protein